MFDYFRPVIFCLYYGVIIHIITAMCDCVTDRGGEPRSRPPESHLGQSEERDGRRNTQTGDKIQSNARRGPYISQRRQKVL